MQITDRAHKETAKDYAKRMLKDNIINLTLEPGSVVSENDLAEAFGLSRTPVRAAIMELARVQMIEVTPQSGSRIAKVDYSLVEEARFVRLILEEAIVELACEQASDDALLQLEEIVLLQSFHLENGSTPARLLELDNAFHAMLFRICGKSLTSLLIADMTLHFDRVRCMILNVVRDIKIVDDHRLIIQALRKKDKSEAKRVMRRHLERYRDDEDLIRQQYPQYIK